MAPLCLDTTTLVTPPGRSDSSYQALVPTILARTNFLLQLSLSSQETTGESSSLPTVPSPSPAPAYLAQSDIDDEPATLLTAPSWAVRDPVLIGIYAKTYIPIDSEPLLFPPGQTFTPSTISTFTSYGSPSSTSAATTTPDNVAFHESEPISATVDTSHYKSLKEHIVPGGMLTESPSVRHLELEQRASSTLRSPLLAPAPQPVRRKRKLIEMEDAKENGVKALKMYPFCSEFRNTGGRSIRPIAATGLEILKRRLPGFSEQILLCEDGG
ncbi:hypothetical protein ABEF95_002963 [Exophiala dermatitidis]